MTISILASTIGWHRLRVRKDHVRGTYERKSRLSANDERKAHRNVLTGSTAKAAAEIDPHSRSLYTPCGWISEQTNQPRHRRKPLKTATPRSGWTIKSVGLAVGIAAAVAVIFAILKSEPPSGSVTPTALKPTRQQPKYQPNTASLRNLWVRVPPGVPSKHLTQNRHAKLQWVMA